MYALIADDGDFGLTLLTSQFYETEEAAMKAAKVMMSAWIVKIHFVKLSSTMKVKCELTLEQVHG